METRCLYRSMNARCLCFLLFIISLVSTGFGFVNAIGEEHTYVIFKDDFEDLTIDNWSFEVPSDAPVGSTWAVLMDEGSNVLSLKGHVDAQAGSYSWGNYTLELRFKFVIPNQAGHISVRMGKIEPRYFIRFDGQDLRLIKNAESELLEVEIVDCVLDPRKWYDLKVICIGSCIQIYIDDSLKIDYVDVVNPIISGRFGIESGIESHLYFDDVIVYSTQNIYVSVLLENAENEINQARLDDYDTSVAENKLKEAYTAYNEGKLSLAGNLAKEAIEAAFLTKKSGATKSPLQPFTINLTWSIQEITGLLTICATIVGIGSWFYRKRTQSRRGRILINKFMEEVDNVFSRYKMNAVRCESELLRLKSEILGEFKQGIIDEENFVILDKRIDFYLKEIRKEFEKEIT